MSWWTILPAIVGYIIGNVAFPLIAYVPKGKYLVLGIEDGIPYIIEGVCHYVFKNEKDYIKICGKESDTLEIYTSINKTDSLILIPVKEMVYKEDLKIPTDIDITKHFEGGNYHTPDDFKDLAKNQNFETLLYGLQFFDFIISYVYEEALEKIKKPWEIKYDYEDKNFYDEDPNEPWGGRNYCDGCDLFRKIEIGVRIIPKSILLYIESDDGHCVWIDKELIGCYGGEAGNVPTKNLTKIFHKTGPITHYIDITKYLTPGNHTIYIWCSENDGYEYCKVAFVIDGISILTTESEGIKVPLKDEYKKKFRLQTIPPAPIIYGGKTEAKRAQYSPDTDNYAKITIEPNNVQLFLIQKVYFKVLPVFDKDDIECFCASECTPSNCNSKSCECTEWNATSRECLVCECREYKCNLEKKAKVIVKYDSKTFDKVLWICGEDTEYAYSEEEAKDNAFKHFKDYWKICEDGCNKKCGKYKEPKLVEFVINDILLPNKKKDVEISLENLKFESKIDVKYLESMVNVINYENAFKMKICNKVLYTKDNKVAIISCNKEGDPDPLVAIAPFLT